MSLSCCESQCRGHVQPGHPGNNAKLGENGFIESHLVQVWNPAGQFWKSADTTLHGEVRVVDAQSLPQIWNLERDDDKALWSFHVKSSDDSKIYISYNTDTSDHKITMELAGSSGKDRYFIALAEPDGRILLQTRRSDEMFLWVKKGALILISGGEDANDIDWTIASSALEPCGTPELLTRTVKRYVNIQQTHSSEKWKSSGSRIGDEIQLITTRKNEKWILTLSPESCTIRAHNKAVQGQTQITNAECFASSKEDAPEDLLLEGNVARAGFKDFVLKTSRRTAGLSMRSVSNGRYIGKKSDDTLQLKESESHAVRWNLVVVHLVFGSDDVIFPALTPV